MSNSSYDITVIGAGAAGLTAAMIAARNGMKTVVLEQLGPGGQVLNAEHIENFPGLKDGIQGIDYGFLLQDHAESSGAEIRIAQVFGLKSENGQHILSTGEGEFRSKVVIIASGSTLRSLGIPGEKKLNGRGVSYCATCDGAFFNDQVVGIVGGGDSALDEAITLTQFASKVYLFHRRDSFRGQKTLQDRVLAESKIKIFWNTVVDEVIGNEIVTSIMTRDLITSEILEMNLSGLFIYVGLKPNTAFLKDTLHLDDSSHIVTDIWMRTNVEGIYASGDVRQNSASQLITSAGDGATAAIAATNYIQGKSWS
jgi:thioredoxin reductase (NADPH)